MNVKSQLLELRDNVNVIMTNLLQLYIKHSTTTFHEHGLTRPSLSSDLHSCQCYCNHDSEENVASSRHPPFQGSLKVHFDVLFIVSKRDRN